MEYIKIPESKIPVFGQSEVIIVGGGLAGLSAAVASSRLGCNTILIENSGSLGGTVTKCLMPSFGRGNPPLIKGIFTDLFEGMKKADAIMDNEGRSNPLDPEIFKSLCFDIVKEAGVELLLHTTVTGAVKIQNKLGGVIIHNKSGFQAVMAKVIVDASGDADVAYLAGESFAKDGELQPMSLMFTVGNADAHRFAEWVQNYPDKNEFWPMGSQNLSNIDLHRDQPRVNVGGFMGMIKKASERGELYLPHDNMALIFLPMEGTVLVNATHIRHLDPLNGKDVTEAEIEGRKQMLSVYYFLKKNVPGFEDCFLMSSASHVGVRESRRVIGEYVLRMEDLQSSRSFYDAVVLHNGRASIHGPGEKQTFISFARPYQVPYRSLQAKVNDNLLVAGRCISADHMAHSAIRGTVCCVATGQAAGTAAALSVKQGVKPRDLDPELLRNSLINQGVILSEPVAK